MGFPRGEGAFMIRIRKSNPCDSGILYFIAGLGVYDSCVSGSVTWGCKLLRITRRGLRMRRVI